MAKKKRRVRISRLIMTLFIILCIVSLALFGVYKGMQWIQDKRDQSAKKEYIAEVIETHNDFVDSINAVVKPSDISQETFDTLKAMALTDTDFSILEQFDENERVSDEFYQQVTQLTNIKGNSQVAKLVLNIDQYSEDILEYYLKDTDRYDFVSIYPERAQYTDGVSALSESLEGVPGLIQWDARWGYVPYGDSDIAIAGCAPTCLSMVLSYLLQNPTLTPNVIASFSEMNGQYVNGVGTAHSLLELAAANYGVNVAGVGIDVESVTEALEAGEVLILNMVPGDFTQIGHFIVAYGLEDGQLKVHDPNSRKRSEQLWDVQTVLDQTAAIWGYYL